jgi:hypothetical protein
MFLPIAALLAATACTNQPGSAGVRATTPPASASAAAARLDGCVAPGDGTQIRLPESAVTTVPAVLLGTGTRGVLLTPEHGGDICQWLPFGHRLVELGYHVLIWDPGTDPLTEIAYFVNTLRTSGARRVVLVGASNGANICAIAATRVRPPVNGLAWLSGEDTMYVAGQMAQPVEPAAKRLTVATLFIASRDDPFHSARTAADLARLAPTRQKKLLTVPGNDHGVALLTGAHRAAVEPALLDFLTAWTTVSP